MLIIVKSNEFDINALSTTEQQEFDISLFASQQEL